jgi:hypothetical protein
MSSTSALHSADTAPASPSTSITVASAPASNKVAQRPLTRDVQAEFIEELACCGNVRASP